MSEKKHTPGPWAVDGHDISPESDFGLGICAVSPVDLGGEKGWYFGEQTTANLNLIASAPDLLEALELLIAETDPLSLNAGEPWCRVRAAIAKARGDQQ